MHLTFNQKRKKLSWLITGGSVINSREVTVSLTLYNTTKESFMKIQSCVVLVAAAAALSGCAVYPTYTTTPVYVVPAPVYVSPPPVVYRPYYYYGPYYRHYRY